MAKQSKGCDAKLKGLRFITKPASCTFIHRFDPDVQSAFFYAENLYIGKAVERL